MKLLRIVASSCITRVDSASLVWPTSIIDTWHNLTVSDFLNEICQTSHTQRHGWEGLRLLIYTIMEERDHFHDTGFEA